MNDLAGIRSGWGKLGAAAVLVLCTAAVSSAQDQGQPEEQTAPVDIPRDRIDWHLKDPVEARAYAEELLQTAREANNRTDIELYTASIARIDEIRRPNQLRLSLDDVIRMMLENSYDIEVESYNPAIETTRVVEAQAAFDAVFFANVNKSISDRPTASQLASGDRNFLRFDSGVRKLLPTGGLVTATYGFQRLKTSLSFQQINPEYFNDLTLELRQPFLRGFGTDFNRSIIRINQNNQQISNLAFSRQVRDRIREIEELYWRLVQARQDVVITGRLVAQFEQIFNYLLSRLDFDITSVQLNATSANLQNSIADFIRVVAEVSDAEDRLTSAMNAQEVNLADDTEIIPTDFPHLDEVTVDRLTEMQTALDFRQEIKEQELRVSTAKINLGRAKNLELPQLDATFQYTISGLAQNLDGAFDGLSTHNFVDYFVGVQFEVPVGNRAPRAAHRRASLERSQAEAALRSLYENILLDVNLSVRRLDTAFRMIAPQFLSTEAREAEVESIVARAERMDLNTLNSELNARTSLANARRSLLAVLVEYNIAIIDLERAKGTLPQYRNVLIPTDGK